MTSLRLEKISGERIPDLKLFSDHTIFQSNEWVNFVSDSKNAEPVFAVVLDGSEVVGRFVGLVVKVGGMSILGSPLPGWTTSYMGFNLKPSVNPVNALLALEKFAFNELKCVHFELLDRKLKLEEVLSLGYKFSLLSGFEIDLTRNEESILKGMSPSCRRNLRKASKVGVFVEAAEDLEFVDEYYAQLTDVFAKQGLVPTYPKSRVRELVDHLLPTGNLLLVRARDKARNSIATGIFPAMNDSMWFWGGASYRKFQTQRPNEAVQWFAMQYWKARGIAKYDMGGGGEYKRKYGGRRIARPWIRKSKNILYEYLRSGVKVVVAGKQILSGLRNRATAAVYANDDSN